MSAEVSNKTSGKIKKKQDSQLRLGLLLATPALIYIIVFMAFPLFYNFFLSLTEANGANLISRTFTFNNFKNYATVLNDHGFWNGLVLSLIFTIACLITQYVIGFALALFFRRPFPGNGVMRALLLVGWILPPVVTGTIFKWIFDSDYGILNYILINMGIIDEGIKWLTVGPTALLAIIIANLWVGIPFNLLLLLSGLHTIDDSLYEAAHVDGANPWQQFWKITFPLMKPVSILSLIHI